MQKIIKGVVLAWGVCIGSSTQAHDTSGIMHSSVQESQKLNNDTVRSFIDTVEDPNSKAVLVRGAMWRRGQVLKACFLDGSEKQKAVTIKAASTLLQNVKLKVDWGSSPGYNNCPTNGGDADIRVTFKQCCWAWVGTQGHSAAAKKAGPASIAISRVHGNGTGEELRIAMHELLHVFGFHHEHQSPASGCDKEIDYAKLAKDKGYDEKMMRTNFLILQNNGSMRLLTTSYDQKSIMHYDIEARYFFDSKNSKCHIGGTNKKPSDIDIKALRDAYPESIGLSKDVEYQPAVDALMQRGDLPEAMKAVLQYQANVKR